MPTLNLTEPELQALAGLVDAGVRATGLRSVREAAVILGKLEEASGPISEPQPQDKPEAGESDKEKVK